MKARDVMVSPVIRVKPSATVQDVARILLQNRISGVPVVDDAGKVIGMVSEGDLMRRDDLGTEHQRSWWLASLFADENALAAEYVKAHARTVGDVMSKRVVAATPDTPLNQIAGLLERHLIKRVPIIDNGELVGIVSRANLIQALAVDRKGLTISLPDAALRENIIAHLKTQPWAHMALVNFTAHDGIVDIWGIALSQTEKNALRVAAEGIRGVRAVNDHVTVQDMSGTY